MKTKDRPKSPSGSSPAKVMKENAALRKEMEEGFRNMVTLQASYEKLKQEDLGSEPNNR